MRDIRSLNSIRYLYLAASAALACCLPGPLLAAGDSRIAVEMPAMMQQHMLSNMRDHLAALNEILVHLDNDELDKAAETAEYRLGMSSLNDHGASHMSKFMPEGMRHAGTSMHKAASRFALKAQEGDALSAYQALSDITSACVACHSSCRICCARNSISICSAVPGSCPGRTRWAMCARILPAYTRLLTKRSRRVTRHE